MTDHFPLVVPGSKTASPAREGRRVMCCAPSLRLLFASSAIEATNELRDYFAAGSTGRVERPDYFCASGMIAPDFFRRGHVSCADLSAPDNRHTSNGGVLERIAKGVSTDHFQLRQRLQTASVQPSERSSTTSRCCKGRHQSCLVSCYHDSARSSSQST